MWRANLIALALAVTTQAQAATNLWICSEIDSTGFKLTDRGWLQGSFTPDKHVLLLDGKRSTYYVNAEPYEVSCTDMIDGRVRCDQLISGTTIFFDPRNGRGAVSHLLGATFTKAGGDTVSLALLKCGNVQ